MNTTIAIYSKLIDYAVYSPNNSEMTKQQLLKNYVAGKGSDARFLRVIFIISVISLNLMEHGVLSVI